MRRAVSGEHRLPSDRPAVPDAGVALLTVLWFLVAMSGLAVGLAELGRATAYAGRNAVRAIETRAAMASAVDIAAATLWRGLLPIDGRLAWRQGPLAMTVSVVPESGKIDLNAASDELIEALATVAVESLDRDPVEATRLADAILDWRDPDGEQRLAGAEAAAYAEAARVGRPHDGPFRFVAELRGVLGVDQALEAVLGPAVTVHHGAAEPSIEPAAPLVRDALDRLQGLGLGMGDGESSFDLDAQPLEEGEARAESGAAPLFVADPAGLYTLDIELKHDNGPSFRQQTVIWIDPPLGTARHAVLESRSIVLSPTLLDLAADGPSPWPGR